MRDLPSLAGLAFALPRFLRRTITLNEARDTLRRRLDDRNANFLRTIERGIFAHPASPYLPMLATAGCELGDITNMVRACGVERTLRSLREQGVYVTFEEFKGRSPIVRGGREIRAQPSDFFNPDAAHQLHTESGGTTGRATSSSTGLPRIADLALYLSVAYDAYGVLRAPIALWRGMLPDGSGLALLLAAARAGNPPVRWFTPLLNGAQSSARFSLATHAVLAMARASGVRLPRPQPIRLDQAGLVARWAAEAVQTAGRCYISTSASMSLRVCQAAKTESLDLTGAIFTGGGEPMTEAKSDGIASVGARSRPNYFSVDTGAMGMSCANPAVISEQHLLTDSVAFIQHPRDVPGTDFSVDAFNVTSLLPWSQKILLNVELDDYGVVEERPCGCPLDALGFTSHVRGIASFRKLTTEGVTFIGTDIVRILEEVLPARFGGTPLDYQLAEEEDAEGFTRVNLRVSPSVAIPSEAAVRDLFLQTLASSGPAADHCRSIWEHAGTLRVTRAEPALTARGKLMPLSLAAARRVRS